MSNKTGVLYVLKAAILNGVLVMLYMAVMALVLWGLLRRELHPNIFIACVGFFGAGIITYHWLSYKHNPFPSELNRKRIPWVAGGYALFIAGYITGIFFQEHLLTIFFIVFYCALLVISVADGRTMKAYAASYEEEIRSSLGVPANERLTMEQLVSACDGERMKSDKRYRQAVQFIKMRLHPKMSRRDILEMSKRLLVFTLGFGLICISCFLCLFMMITAYLSGIYAVDLKTTGLQTLGSFVLGILIISIYYHIFPDEENQK